MRISIQNFLFYQFIQIIFYLRGKVAYQLCRILYSNNIRSSSLFKQHLPETKQQNYKLLKNIILFN